MYMEYIHAIKQDGHDEPCSPVPDRHSICKILKTSHPLNLIIMHPLINFNENVSKASFTCAELINSLKKYEIFYSEICIPS